MMEYVVGLYLLLNFYTRIKLFIIKRRIKGPGEIRKGAEGFFYKRGKIGVLMLHGFSSSPAEFRRLAKKLAEKNITCYCPLMPGHGTSPERMTMIKWYQWQDFLNNQLKVMEENCNKIFLVGNSLGGNYAINMANKSDKIKGIVLMATPIYVRGGRFSKMVFAILRSIKLFQKKISPTVDGKIYVRGGRFSKMVFAILRSIKLFQKKISPTVDGKTTYDRTYAYDVLPLKSVKEAFKVMKVSQNELKNVKSPVLIMQSADDYTLPKSNAMYIYNNIGSKKKKITYINLKQHVFLVYVHEKVFQDTYGFIKANS